MPNDGKAMVSAAALILGLAFAFWERWWGQAHLFWVVVGLSIFAVVAMWVFPEAGVPKGTVQKDGSVRDKP